MMKGHCHCGAVTWEAEGAETWACYCHCADCRRNCAAPVTAFFGVPLSRFRWTGAEPALYASSPGTERRFCGACGTPMAYQTVADPGAIHLYAATLDDPAAYRPRFHVFYAEHLPWLEIADDLPRYQKYKTSPED